MGLTDSGASTPLYMRLYVRPAAYLTSTRTDHDAAYLAMPFLSAQPRFQASLVTLGRSHTSKEKYEHRGNRTESSECIKVSTDGAAHPLDSFAEASFLGSTRSHRQRLRPTWRPQLEAKQSGLRDSTLAFEDGEC